MWMNRCAALLAACVLLTIFGCARRNGRESERLASLRHYDSYTMTHVVSKGESLGDICRLYYDDASRKDEVARVNGLATAGYVAAGTVLQLHFTKAEWSRAEARRQALDPYNEGVAALQNGHLAVASEAFHRALTLDPDFSDAQYNLALVWLQRGHYKDAEAMLLPLTDRDPEDLAAWTAYGRTLYEQERYEEAVAAYDEVLARDPDNAAAGFARAVALQDGGHRQKALQAWDSFLDHHPQGRWADRARAAREALLHPPQDDSESRP